MPNYVRGSGQEIPLADYAPDLDPTTPGILLDANNAVPTMKGYMARNMPVVVTSANGALPGLAQGAYISQLIQGGPNPTNLYASTGGRIYTFNAGWVVLPGPVQAPVSRVRFTQFNDDIIATADGWPTPLIQVPLVAGFNALTGSPPANAPIVISVGGFVVFFAGASWFSSAAGVDNNYVPNIQTLAATGTLYDVPGNITAAATLYRSIVAFKEGGTWVGVFSGPPFTWTFQLISGQIGTYGQECVVTLPDSIAFLGTDDFYITTGYTPQRIPNSLKEWFFATADRSQLPNVIGWYDHLNSVIYWHFVSTQTPTPGLLDRYVSYNVRVGRWSTGYLNTSFVVPNTQDSVTNLTGTTGSPEAGYFFDPNNVLMTWDANQGAAPGTMYVKTGYLGDETNLSQLQRFRAKWNVYPTQDFASAYHTNILGALPTFDASVVKNPNDDWYNCLQYDRWHQLQINSVGPAEITAYAFQARVGGTR